MIRVDIGIPTYKRPTQLVRLLNSLTRLDIPPEIDVGIIIVDNHAELSAKRVVDAFAAQSTFRVRYLTEPRLGVVHVRNRLLDATDADFLAMADDDEYATPRWLAGLMETVLRHNADVVIGHVELAFPPEMPNWLLRYHRNPSITDQSRLYSGYTANTMVRMTSVRARGLRFDPAFSITGGEDTDFFERFAESGGHFRFSLEGRLIEPVDPKRISLRWHAMRNLRVGQTNALIFGRKDPPLCRAAERIARGLLGSVLLCVGSLVFPVSRLQGIRMLMTGIRNLGHASVLFGGRAEEYANR